MTYYGLTSGGRTLQAQADSIDDAWALLAENAAEFGEHLEYALTRTEYLEMMRERELADYWAGMAYNS